MKRFLTYIVLITSFISGTGMTANAEEYVHHGQRPCVGWRFDLTNPATRQTRGPRLVACVFTKLGLVEQVGIAQLVVERESGYYPSAYNPSGCGGLMQHMLRYWPGRRLDYLPLWLFPRRQIVSWTNPLANLWVGARMVKAGGWGLWAATAP